MPAIFRNSVSWFCTIRTTAKRIIDQEYECGLECCVFSRRCLRSAVATCEDLASVLSGLANTSSSSSSSDSKSDATDSAES